MEKDQQANQLQTNPLNEILTERELLDMFGFKKEFLDNLRRKQQFPFCKISDRVRFYLVEDVYDFIKGRRQILNRH